MADEAVMQVLRNCRKRTIELLDEESFNVSEARGKLSKYWDIACFDQGCYKLVKVYVDEVPKHDLDRLLHFNRSPNGSNTILQVFIWKKNAQKPVARPKLFYNDPKQEISEELKKYVK